MRFTDKALDEMHEDGLPRSEVIESLMNARQITKTIRSRHRRGAHRPEQLYVIKSYSFSGTFIYTKGTIRREPEGEVFYILISAKLATLGA